MNPESAGPEPRMVEHPNGDIELLSAEGQRVGLLTKAQIESMNERYHAHAVEAARQGHGLQLPQRFYLDCVMEELLRQNLDIPGMISEVSRKAPPPM